MRIKATQIATRLTPEAYAEFSRVRQVMGDISESSLINHFLVEFFERGLVDSPENKLRQLQDKLDNLQNKLKQHA